MLDLWSYLRTISFGVVYSVGILLTLVPGTTAADFPAAGWHRGDVSSAQENSYKAVHKALHSLSPNVEVDILDFFDTNGQRIGLLSHDYKMDRIIGSEGTFMEHNDHRALPLNTANPDLAGQPFMSVIDLFELIRKRKEEGIIPMVSLDMKEEGKTGKAFGEWVGTLIKKYGFETHVFASSFFKSNVEGVRKGCEECLVGGVVFNDHYALQYLDPKHTSLDLTFFSKLTYFVGFLAKADFQHDFVLIQDSVLLANSDLIDFWKTDRNVKFVGVFSYERDTPYTEEESSILQRVDWLELEPAQMKQWIRMQLNKSVKF